MGRDWTRFDRAKGDLLGVAGGADPLQALKAVDRLRDELLAAVDAMEEPYWCAKCRRMHSPASDVGKRHHPA